MASSLLAADLLNFVTILLKLGGGLSLLFLVIILLPIFVQISMNVFISIIRAQLRIDIRPILDLILFPGSIIKVTILWFVLTLHGYEYKLFYTMPERGKSATGINNQYRGPGFVGYQRKEDWESTNMLKLAFLMSIASYATIPIFIILLLFNSSIITTLFLLVPSHLVMPLYNFALISIGLGGIPVPQESMLILWAFLNHSPHIVLNIMFNVIGGLIIAPYIGGEATLVLVAILFAIGMMIVQGLQPEDDENDQDDWLVMLEQMIQ